MEAVSHRRAPPPPPPPLLHTVVAPPPPQPPTRELVHLPPPSSSSSPHPHHRPQHHHPQQQQQRGELISLSSPRRPHALSNDYVDSPVAATNTTVLSQSGTIFNGCGGSSGGGNSDFVEVQPRLPITQQPKSVHHVMQTQPKKCGESGGAQSFSVEDGSVSGTMGAGSSECKASIYCPHCQKCRCAQCTEHRELPKAWLCNNKVECSCQRCVDCTSCLCVVRGLFYHSCANADGDTSVSPSDAPCACCEQPHCCKRWLCIGAMSLFLPCLCLYWPLQCCHNVVTWHYNRCCRRNGCRCQRGRERTKGLLLDSESSSA